MLLRRNVLPNSDFESPLAVGQLCAWGATAFCLRNRASFNGIQAENGELAANLDGKLDFSHPRYDGGLAVVSLLGQIGVQR